MDLWNSGLYPTMNNTSNILSFIKGINEVPSSHLSPHVFFFPFLLTFFLRLLWGVLFASHFPSWCFLSVRPRVFFLTFFAPVFRTFILAVHSRAFSRFHLCFPCVFLLSLFFSLRFPSWRFSSSRFLGRIFFSSRFFFFAVLFLSVFSSLHFLPLIFFVAFFFFAFFPRVFLIGLSYGTLSRRTSRLPSRARTPRAFFSWVSSLVFSHLSFSRVSFSWASSHSLFLRPSHAHPILFFLIFSFILRIPQK